ncbi:MAG TPA: NifU family protein [Acidimicrobiales bacterium]|jgi:Fe-S cluster biogenesis protein NfuA|nr:NifU family protein [Acidimicrobiales bacterium]
MASEDELSYFEVLGRIGELAEQLTSHPDPKVSEGVGELLDWIDAFHRDGLGRLVEMIRSWRGEIFLESVSADDIVGTFLGAYGLGEGGETVSEATASVDAALEQVRPLVESHGGAIEVVSVADGVVTVRMKGTCDGCPSSAATLTYGVEQALRDNWANFRRLELVDAADAVDPAKADLTCVTVPDAVLAPQAPLLQIRGHEQR